MRRAQPKLASYAVGGEGVRVGILSDTHGVVDERVLAALSGCDVAVHAGDVVGAAVLAALRERVAEVFAVAGNNDVAAKWPRSELAELDALAERLWLELPGGALAVEHGHRAGSGRERHPRLRRRYAGARAVVYGHSHRLLIDDDEEPWVLNPGAAGRERTFGGPSLLLLHATTKRWQVEATRFETR